MKFSIITICLNSGEALIATINSIINQSFDDYELIIKDGLSTDGSIESIPYNSHLRLIRKKDSGIYDAMNQAIVESSGDYLIFMNSGDLFYDKNVLKELSQRISTRQSLYYGKTYNRRLGRISICPPDITKKTCYRTMICHQSMVFSRKLFEERLYNTDFRITADREYLLWAICMKHIVPQRVDFVIADYEGGGVSDFGNNIQQRKNEYKAINRMYFSARELFVYRIVHTLTFPGIRKRIAVNPKLSKYYVRVVSFLYGTAKKEKNE